MVNALNVGLYGIGLDTYWPQFEVCGRVLKIISAKLVSAWNKPVPLCNCLALSTHLSADDEAGQGLKLSL